MAKGKKQEKKPVTPILIPSTLKQRGGGEGNEEEKGKEMVKSLQGTSICFLGTNSAMPNAYRNVSACALRFSDWFLLFFFSSFLLFFFSSFLLFFFSSFLLFFFSSFLLFFFSSFSLFYSLIFFFFSLGFLNSSSWFLVDVGEATQHQVKYHNHFPPLSFHLSPTLSPPIIITKQH